MDRSRNYVFTPLMKEVIHHHCGSVVSNTRCRVSCALCQSMDLVLCCIAWVSWEELIAFLFFFMASIWMPPSEHSCLLDMLGVVFWERWSEVLASGHTHHPWQQRWSGSHVSSFCASGCRMCEAVDSVYTMWDDCCLHKLDYSGWKSQFITCCCVSSTKSLDRSLC